MTLLVLGLLALFAQGVAAAAVSPRALPDLGLLLVVAAAIGLRSASAGVLFAALLGYASDCLSGSLLGQHMLLSVAAYGAARIGATQLNLRGPLPQATFVFFLAAAHAAGLWLLVVFVNGSLGPPGIALGDLLIHSLVTGLAAPIVVEGLVRLLARLGEDDGQRPLRLEPRTYA